VKNLSAVRAIPGSLRGKRIHRHAVVRFAHAGRRNQWLIPWNFSRVADAWVR